MFNRTQALLGVVLIRELYGLHLTWNLRKGFRRLNETHDILMRIKDIQIDELVRVLERHNVPREEFQSVIDIDTPRSK